MAYFFIFEISMFYFSGKYKAIELGAIPALLKLLTDSNSECRLNVVKALTTLAEAPEGRAKLLEFIDDIAGMQSDPSRAVQRAAEIAKSVILWKP